MSYLPKIITKNYKKFYHLWYRRWLRPKIFPDDPIYYPAKLRRLPELATEFLAERRVRQQTTPRQPLSVETYRPLIVDQKSEQVVCNVVGIYNRLIKGKYYPTTVTIEDMDYIIKECETFTEQKKNLHYLFIREFDDWRHAKSQTIRKQLNQEVKKFDLEELIPGVFDNEGRLQYGYWRNTMFSRYYDNAIRRQNLTHLRVATLFGQKIVIDCSFDKEMQEYETESLGRQMTRIYHMNKATKEPFDLHFCNCDPESRGMKHFYKYMKPITPSDLKYCLNVHRETYRELFPDQKFIYLSPDGPNLMKEFDHNAIYIMGSLIGKTCRLPLTKWKARDEGIECQRLPIHKYVELNPLVKKVLSFQGVYKILLELKEHNDWELAFKRGIMEHKLKEPLPEDLRHKSSRKRASLKV